MTKDLYTVMYDDGKQRVAVAHLLPARLPKWGDTYEWVQETCTVGGHSYKPGDRMIVLERTGFVPHHRTSELGNLLVSGPHGTSVWTSFEHAIATGHLKLILEGKP